MALSDCEKCWDTPCHCGYEYRNYTNEAKIDLAAAILGIPSVLLGAILKERLVPNHPLLEKD